MGLLERQVEDMLDIQSSRKAVLGAPQESTRAPRELDLQYFQLNFPMLPRQLKQ
jgi:hypothetical protein